MGQNATSTKILWFLDILTVLPTSGCGFAEVTGSFSNDHLGSLAAWCSWAYFEESLLPSLSKCGCRLWNWCSADSFGFSVNPRRDQHVALKSLSSSNRGIKRNVCTISLQIKSLTLRVALRRRRGKIIPDFDFELARQSCPSASNQREFVQQWDWRIWRPETSKQVIPWSFSQSDSGRFCLVPSTRRVWAF